jgi:hypothetical protein
MADEDSVEESQSVAGSIPRLREIGSDGSGAHSGVAHRCASATIGTVDNPTREGFSRKVTSLVLLTTRAPSKLADDLTLAGYRVIEARAVSEVLYLCEQHDIDAVVISADVDDPDVVEAQMRHITIKLKPEATAKELI